MRRVFVLTALVVAMFAISATSATLADEPKDSKPAQAAKDPNFRRHNGRWWYWMPAQKHWMVYSGGKWVTAAQAQANQAARSFSYQQGSQAAPSYYRTFDPGTVENTRIINSWGYHSAGSKAMGSY